MIFGVMILVQFLFIGVVNSALALDEVTVTSKLLQKMMPMPTVPAYLSRTHRVGAQRYMQFGQRCWDQEACTDCVCCGYCHKETFLCISPPGSTDYCLLYERLSIHTDIEKQNATLGHKLPDDFPDVTFRK